MCIAGVALLPDHGIAASGAHWLQSFLASLFWCPSGLGNKSAQPCHSCCCLQSWARAPAWVSTTFPTTFPLHKASTPSCLMSTPRTIHDRSGPKVRHWSVYCIESQTAVLSPTCTFHGAQGKTKRADFAMAVHWPVQNTGLVPNANTTRLSRIHCQPYAFSQPAKRHLLKVPLPNPCQKAASTK